MKIKNNLPKMNLQLHNDGVGTKNIMASFKEVSEEIKGLIETQKAEIKENGEVTEETKTALEDLSEKFIKLQEQYDEIDIKLQRTGGEGKEEIKSIGEMFVESEQYTEMIKAGRNVSNAMEVKTLSTATDGIWVRPDFAPFVAPYERRLTVRDLFGQANTTSNMISFIQEVAYDKEAATFGEFTPESEDEKPRSKFYFEQENIPVTNIGHWLPATRQIIEDSAQLASYVNGRLIYGIKLEEEEQLLYGDGLGGNLTGVVPLATAFDDTVVEAEDTKIDIIRRAITQAALADYPVDGVVLHPRDWEDIELMKGTNGHYIWVNINEGGASRLWRIPVVESPAMEEGEFLVGAFGMGGTVWDRKQASIRISDSHEGYFTKNLLAILAEERIALTIYRPASFVTGDFTTILPPVIP